MSRPHQVQDPFRRLPGRWRLWRRWLRIQLVGRLGPWAVRLWFKTLRTRIYGPGMISPNPRKRTAVIYAFWHERLLAALFFGRGFGTRTLVSAHGDGEMVAMAAERMGFKVFRGSTTRQGFRGMWAMLEDVPSGFDYGLTPDGPRGPRRCFQTGTVFFASRSGLPIVPITIAYGRYWQAHSWDRFVLPWAFAQALAYVGRPIHVPPDLSGQELEAWADKLGRVLTEITDEHDRVWRQRYADAVPVDRYRRM